MSDPNAKKPLPRRRFLQLGTTALGAGLLSTTPGWAKSLLALSPGQGLDFRRPPEAHREVVVIGGGISGLTAAWTLKKMGRDFQLLEVRDRVGGRTLNEATAGGGYAELGGQWVGPTQDAVLNLMSRLGIGKFTTYHNGRMVNDTRETLGPLEIADYYQAIQRIDRLAHTVPLANPWHAPQAAQWDAMTVQDWMNANMRTDAAKDLIDFTVQVDFGGPARSVSFLWFLFYVHSGTDFETMSDAAQRWRIDGGAHTISQELEQRLPNRIEFGAGVDGILWGDRGALIHFGGHRVISADKVIVAMMPKDMERLGFFPQLPAQRQSLNRLWSAGGGDKYFAVYPTPFWRAQGLNGQAISDNQFIVMSFDNSPPSGTPGILGGFGILEGENRPPTRALRRRLVLRAFEDFFGPQARNPISFHEKSWGLDPHTAGCVTPLAPGLLTAYGPAIRTPIGPFHWAGTESSEVWCGYMDGAVRAGVRAAQEVDALLP